LALAASAETLLEHPLAEAVRAAAKGRGLPLAEPEQFEAEAGWGCGPEVNGHAVCVGSRRMMKAAAGFDPPGSASKTLLFVERDSRPAGVLAAADTLRPEVPAALAAVRRLGVRHVELLHRRQRRTAAALAGEIRKQLPLQSLPEDKIAVVKEYQARATRW